MRVAVGTLTELPAGRGKAISVGGQAIVLFQANGRVYALHDRCPHAGAPLSLGQLRQSEVVCSRHGWAFDVATGESIPHQPAFDVRTYPVTIVGDQIILELPDHD